MPAARRADRARRGVQSRQPRVFQFNDVLENGKASPWLDWFTFHDHPANSYDHGRPPGYEAWAGLHALPKLNTDNPQVREYLMCVGEHWIRKGTDGWRRDVPSELALPARSGAVFDASPESRNRA